MIERLIASGGMGFVMAAHHPQLRQTVALKLLNTELASNPDVAARFLREARAAARLRNQHIARVMDAGTDDRGRHYIVMEYLSGSDLRALCRREVRVPFADTVGYALHACEALAEAHAAGIIHRDLKPENLFLTKGTDGSPLIKMLDFGISKTLQVIGVPVDVTASHVITSKKEILGSPAYMSPEQLRTPDNVDGRTDIWALGVILYELLSGKRPFAPPELPDLIAEVLSLTPPPPQTLRNDIPAVLGAVVLKCLAKNPDERFHDVGELAEALHNWAPPWARGSAARAARTTDATLPRGSAPEVTIVPAAGETPNPAAARGGTPGPIVATDTIMQARSRRGTVALVTVVVVSLGFGVYLVRSGTERPALRPPASPTQAVTAPAPAAAPTPARVPAPAPPSPTADEIEVAPPSSKPRSPGPRPPAARRVGGDRTGYDHLRAKRTTGRMGAAASDPLDGRR